MMRKVLFLFLFSVLLFASFPNQSKAEETGPSKELTEVIIQEAEPTIDLDSLPNLAPLIIHQIAFLMEMNQLSLHTDFLSHAERLAVMS
ncbi:hypothetical protein V2I71_20745 [Peribacillus frigoritolerans]|uniref:hypothetical protein n=1 Tax=Peribacillus frigoritolerans TaxID=450367 RepID=UPI002ED6655B|nr:hypothetical protein V2I71_20745 [Peribacillus frigoritolerans]